MILVDTSVWVDFFNRRNSIYSQKLKELIKNEEELCLVDIIITEILQGINDDTLFDEIKTYLFDFPIFKAKDIDTYIRTADIYRICRKNGRPIRKTIDALISAIAIENNLEIFHNDRDFDTISKYNRLKVFQFDKIDRKSKVD